MQSFSGPRGLPQFRTHAFVLTLLTRSLDELSIRTHGGHKYSNKHRASTQHHIYTNKNYYDKY